MLLVIAIFFSAPIMALEKGEILKPLSIESVPTTFHYEPNGKSQLIMVYPAKISSHKIGKFSKRMIEAGFCPQSIIDMENRAWYVPVKYAEKQIRQGIENSPNPDCSVTADYTQQAITSWGLEIGAVVIVVDGTGVVRYIGYGIPNKNEELTIINLLKGDAVEGNKL